jgi:hypothetical protein
MMMQNTSWIPPYAMRPIYVGQGGESVWSEPATKTDVTTMGFTTAAISVIGTVVGVLFLKALRVL